MSISPKAKTRSLVYELRITLQDFRPPIWRLIQIPNTSRLCCLHDALQIVLGWTDTHLHQFEKKGKYWGVPEHFEDDDIDILDERRTEISTILKAQGDSVVYVYDLGDDWRHEVVLEKILLSSGRTVRPLCLSGDESESSDIEKAGDFPSMGSGMAAPTRPSPLRQPVVHGRYVKPLRLESSCGSVDR